MTYQLDEKTKVLSKQFEHLFKLTKNLNNEEYFKLLSKIEIYKVMHTNIRNKSTVKAIVKKVVTNDKKTKTKTKMKRFKDYIQYLDF